MLETNPRFRNKRLISGRDGGRGKESVTANRCVYVCGGGRLQQADKSRKTRR